VEHFGISSELPFANRQPQLQALLGIQNGGVDLALKQVLPCLGSSHLKEHLHGIKTCSKTLFFCEDKRVV